MRHARFLLGLMAGSLLIAGCMKPFFSSSNARSQAAHPPRAYSTPAVAVRFFMPPDAERYGDMTSDTSMQLVVDSKYKGFVDADNDGIADTPDSQPMHVALWGGPFYGHETTYTLTSLDPGDYTFAVIDRDKAKAIQGWIHVNHSGLEVADILQRWKAEMPKMKQWLAYDFELQGKLNTSDAQVFESFARQLRAFERLERELDQAIAHELEVQHSSRQQNSAFLEDAEVLLFPGDKSLFRPTTKPAFTPADFNEVQKGETRSKMVLVADYPTAQWKLGLVNQLTNELGRCKAVFVEEADRLARRKRFYALTDHIYNHDRKFVENEMRLQQCLATIDRLNDQMSQLRDRRMALAFITGLFAPDNSMEALDRQEQDLVRERAVLQTQRERFDKLFEETDEDSARRVVFERSRQETNRAIEDVNQQIERVADARKAMTKLREDTDVIYRQGDQSMVASSFFDKDIPFPFRQTVEQEALMSIRVEPTDQLHIPSILANMAAMRLGAESAQYAIYSTRTASSRAGHATGGPVPAKPEPASQSSSASAKWTKSQTSSSASHAPSKSSSFDQKSSQTSQTPPVESTSTFVTRTAKQQPAQPEATNAFVDRTRPDQTGQAQTGTFGQSPSAHGWDEPNQSEAVDPWEDLQLEPQPSWKPQQAQAQPKPAVQTRVATRSTDEPTPQPASATKRFEQASQQTKVAQRGTDEMKSQPPSVSPQPKMAERTTDQTKSQHSSSSQPWKPQQAKSSPASTQRTQVAKQAQVTERPSSQDSFDQKPHDMKQVDQQSSQRYVQSSSQSQPVVTPAPQPKQEVRTEMQTTSTHSVRTTSSRQTQIKTTPGQQDDSYQSTHRTHDGRKYQQTRYEKDGTQSTKMRQASDRPQQGQKQAQPDDDCPWLIKLLVPPCWFIEKD